MPIHNKKVKRKIPFAFPVFPVVSKITANRNDRLTVAHVAGSLFIPRSGFDNWEWI